MLEMHWRGCGTVSSWLQMNFCRDFGLVMPRMQANRSFFSEIIASISDLKFSRDGRYILSRDYMTLKLWDVNMNSSPVAIFPVHEHLRQRVGCLISWFGFELNTFVLT